MSTPEVASMITEDTTVFALFDRAVARTPDRIYVSNRRTRYSFRKIGESVTDTAKFLEQAGIGRHSRVGVRLENSVAHLVVVLALLKLEAVWVPINTRLKDAGIRHVLGDCWAEFLIDAGSASSGVTAPDTGADPADGTTFPTGLPAGSAGPLRVTRIASQMHRTLAPGVRVVIYTSGTTGPAKGVQVTDSMLRAAAVGSIFVTEPQADDLYFVWEPLYHVGGAQMIVVPLLTESALYLTSLRDTGQLAGELIASRATHLHYLGGTLRVLLEQQPSVFTEGNLRMAWGAGTPPAIRARVAEDDGIEVRECYGQTEASSVNTVNTSPDTEGIGRPLPWFEARLDGPDAPSSGELLLRGRLPGLVTPGYVGHEPHEAVDGLEAWWRTGDAVAVMDGGSLRYLGRLTDSFRVRGENVSAWEIEQVAMQAPGVAECAVTAAPAAWHTRDDDELVLHIVPRPSVTPDVDHILAYLRGHLARFQVPSYVRLTRQLPQTPSGRVTKWSMSYTRDDCIDTRSH